MIALSKVDFPDPFGPITAVIEPASARTLTDWTTGKAPYPAVKP
jgi:hypothetical protein